MTDDEEIPDDEPAEVQAYVRGYLKGAREWYSSADMLADSTLRDAALREARREYGVRCPDCGEVWATGRYGFHVSNDVFGYTCAGCGRNYEIVIEYGDVESITKTWPTHE